MQLRKNGIINVEVVFLTIVATEDVVASMTVLPPVLVHPKGPVTTLLLTPLASRMYPFAYYQDLNPPKLLLKSTCINE